MLQARTLGLVLPWHRLYMTQMEEELGEALPYWDWTVDKEVPDLWKDIKAPMKPPLTSECVVSMSHL